MLGLACIRFSIVVASIEGLAFGRRSVWARCADMVYAKTAALHAACAQLVRCAADVGAKASRLERLPKCFQRPACDQSHSPLCSGPYAFGMVPSGVSLSTACGSTCASFSV